jgi:putative peptide zinc metalloprotease protein
MLLENTIADVDFEKITPELSSEITLDNVDSDSFVVHQTEHNLRVKINLLTYNLLNIIDGKRNIVELTQVFNDTYQKKFLPKDIHSILYNGIFTTNGIIKSNAKIRIENSSSYLTFSFPLIKAKTVYKVSHIFGFLFNPRYFYLSAITMIFFMIIVFVTNLSVNSIYNGLTKQYMIYLVIFSLFSTILHELGHATACRKFGASHGNIGAGFYLFMPVFYADVSDAWKLKSSERVIIDFAGIYMEILISSILTILFLISHKFIFLITAFYTLIQTYRNLNPFLRFDAYWAVSDYFNIPNLRKDSNAKLKQTFSYFFKHNSNPFQNKKDILLFLYAFISMALIGLFLFVVLVLDIDSVIYLPYNLYIFFKTILTEFNTITFEWLKLHLLKLLIPVSFYFIASSVLIKQIKKIKKNEI